MTRPSWFRYEPDKTATGYRWLDLLTAPFWYVTAWWTTRQFWKVMRVGNDSIRETKQWVRAMWDMPEPPPLDDLLRRIGIDPTTEEER